MAETCVVVVLSLLNIKNAKTKIIHRRPSPRGNAKYDYTVLYGRVVFIYATSMPLNLTNRGYLGPRDRSMGGNSLYIDILAPEYEFIDF